MIQNQEIIMSDIFKTIGSYRLVPVVKIENAADAPALGDALCEGGFRSLKLPSERMPRKRQ